MLEDSTGETPVPYRSEDSTGDNLCAKQFWGQEINLYAFTNLPMFLNTYAVFIYFTLKYLSLQQNNQP